MATPLSILLPSAESPVNPNPLFQLPLPIFDEKSNQSEIDRESVRPLLEWQLSPAIDRASLSGRRAILELYHGMTRDGEVVAQAERNLSLDEFAERTADVLRKTFKEACGVDIDAGTSQQIVSAYNLRLDDPTSVQDLILGIKGGLNPYRLDLVRDVFRYISSKASSSKHFLKTAKALFNPAGHPRSRELGTDRILQEFHNYWGRAASASAGSASEPKFDSVELIEFEYYYAGVSAGFEGDERFEKMIFGCWPGLKDKVPAGATGDFKLGSISEDKRAVASRVRKLEVLVNDSRMFRTALDLCMTRHPPPPAPPAHRPFWARTYMCSILSELLSLVGYTLSNGADDEEILDSLYRRVLKEAGVRSPEMVNKDGGLTGAAGGQAAGALGGIMEFEGSLKSALRRECNFLEYKIVARVAQV